MHNIFIFKKKRPISSQPYKSNESNKNINKKTINISNYNERYKTERNSSSNNKNCDSGKKIRKNICISKEEKSFTNNSFYNSQKKNNIRKREGLNEFKNKENEYKINRTYENLIEKNINEIKILKLNECNYKNKEEIDIEEILKNNNLLKEENNSLKKQIEKKMMSLEQLDQEIEELKKELKCKKKEHENEINQMKNKNDELKKEINKYKDEINNMNIKIEKLNEKIKKLEAVNNIKEQNIKLKDIEKEKEKLRQNSIDNSKLQRECDNLKIKYLGLIVKTKNMKSVKNTFSTDKKKCIKSKNKNNNIQNLSGSRDDGEPLKNYKNPPLVGLNNIGATCFMNSTLQCLSQTKGLTNYFLNEKSEVKIINNNIALKNKNNLQLSPVYLELIKILWKKDGEKSFSPITFMNTVNNMNPLFKTGLPGDAKDFIIFVLEQLHKELNKSVNINILISQNYHK